MKTPLEGRRCLSAEPHKSVHYLLAGPWWYQQTLIALCSLTRDLYLPRVLLHLSAGHSVLAWALRGVGGLVSKPCLWPNLSDDPLGSILQPCLQPQLPLLLPGPMDGSSSGPPPHSGLSIDPFVYAQLCCCISMCLCPTHEGSVCVRVPPNSYHHTRQALILLTPTTYREHKSIWRRKGFRMPKSLKKHHFHFAHSQCLLWSWWGFKDFSGCPSGWIAW